MFDNLTGAVGFAIHEDRLAQAAKNGRLAEATRGRHGKPEGAHPGYRAEFAALLVALATRIAPALVLPGEHTGMMP